MSILNEASWIKNDGKMPNAQTVHIRLAGCRDDMCELDGLVRRYSQPPQRWDWGARDGITIHSYIIAGE